VKPARLHADVFQEVFQENEFPSGIVITFQVMAFTGVSPGNPHAVRTVPEGRQNKLGGHPSRAGNADDPEVGRVLKPVHTGKIRRAVGAPVAEKGRNPWFPVENPISIASQFHGPLLQY
jgi:hypothetical protein